MTPNETQPLLPNIPSVDTSLIARAKRINKLFLITVVIPTSVAVAYFGFAASDVYISESRFVLRSPERQTASPLGMLFKGAGFSRAQDDSYIIQDYILSRDALKALDEKLQLGKAFSDSRVDVFSRFSGLDHDLSFESLHLYYKKKITVQLDTASSITTVSTRAFTAEDAHALNKQLLDLSEALVNKLNERGRQDMLRVAAQDVAEAEKRAHNAALALASYRSEKGVIDPEKQSAIPLQQIAKMQDELLATRSQMMQIESLSKENPQLPVLRQRVQLLEREIQAEIQRVTGGDHSLAGKAGEFQRLALDKEFSEKMLASAMSSLEQARSEAQRQQLYLERVAQPSKPDEAMEPRRFRAVLVTLIVSLILWGVLTLLIAGVKEHHE